MKKITWPCRYYSCVELIGLGQSPKNMAASGAGSLLCIRVNSQAREVAMGCGIYPLPGRTDMQQPPNLSTSTISRNIGHREREKQERRKTRKKEEKSFQQRDNLTSNPTCTIILDWHFGELFFEKLAGRFRASRVVF